MMISYKTWLYLNQRVLLRILQEILKDGDIIQDRIKPQPVSFPEGTSSSRLVWKDNSGAVELNWPEICCQFQISSNVRHTSSFFIFQSKVSSPRREGWWVAMAMSSSSSSLSSRLPRHRVRRFPDILAKVQHISESSKLKRLDSRQL